MLFRHQAVRDLAWCCFSSPLLRVLPDSDAEIWPRQSHSADLTWLTRLDNDPTPLLAELAQLKSSRLGLYYEALWRFYWQQHADWELLAHNMQVNLAGKTLGAFDFIAKNKNDYWHIETAVKLYLGFPANQQTPEAWDQWLGPNCNDRLDLKLQRLQHHQLPLSEQGPGRAQLATLVGGQPHWRRAVCLQGYLFYPAQAVMAAPMACDPGHGRGYWWYLRDFARALHAASVHDGYWMILPRHRWLSAGHTEDINELLHGKHFINALQHWVEVNGRPQLITAMVNTDGAWREIMRGFIVPDHWPGTERPSRNK